MPSGLVASARLAATASISFAPRHTPLGLPVEPDVNVIFAVPCGKGVARAARRNSADESGNVSASSKPKACNMACIDDGATTVFAPAASSV
ncbi:hypothetical protein D3C87_1782780 [compost metagenome]